MDNGPEFIAKITANWSFMYDIEFIYIQPGKLAQNAFVERFNGSYRRGVLNKYIFENLEQVREQTQIWMDDYNHFRPHDALGKIPPIKYAEINSNGNIWAQAISFKEIYSNQLLKYQNEFQD